MALYQGTTSVVPQSANIWLGFSPCLWRDQPECCHERNPEHGIGPQPWGHQDDI